MNFNSPEFLNHLQRLDSGLFLLTKPVVGPG